MQTAKVLCFSLQQPDTDQWAIEGFYIYFGPFDDQQIDYQRQMVLGSTVRHGILANLDANVAYSIRMQSYTAAGTLSQFSNTVVKQTLGEPSSDIKSSPIYNLCAFVTF